MQTITLRPISEDHELDGLISTVGAGVGLGKKIFGGIFGGGRSKACKQKEAQAAQVFATEFSASERRELCRILDDLEGCNKGSDPEGLAFEYVGGQNCNVPSSNTGKLRWIKIVDDKIDKKRRKKQQQRQQQQQQRNSNVPATTAQAGFLSGVSTPVKVSAAVLLTGLVVANRKQIGKAIS